MYKVDSIFLSWNSHCQIFLRTVVNIINVIENFEFKYYKEYISAWLEEKKCLAFPYTEELANMIKEIELSKHKNISKLIKDAHLSEEQQRKSYEPHEKIFEVFTQNTTQIDFGFVSLYDNKNQIIISVKLEDLYIKACEKYPYDMYWFNLFSIKDIKLYSYDKQATTSPTKSDLNSLLQQLSNDKKSRVRCNVANFQDFIASEKIMKSLNSKEIKKNHKKNIFNFEKDYKKTPQKRDIENYNAKLVGSIDLMLISTLLDSKNDEKEIIFKEIKLINLTETLINRVNKFRFNWENNWHKIGFDRSNRVRDNKKQIMNGWDIKKDFLIKYDFTNIEISIQLFENEFVGIMCESIKKDKTEYFTKQLNILKFNNFKIFLKSN